VLVDDSLHPTVLMFFITSCSLYLCILFFDDQTASSGLGTPHYPGFTITLSYTHHTRVGLESRSPYRLCQTSLLSASAKVRKATMSFVMSVCLSVRPSISIQQLGCHWTDFHQISCLNIFLKSVNKNRT
jgi:hypothetical protein